ncbi:hypothetical protein V7O66_08005 [Methanolobus sp. ZRKC3]|uniref:hypothetical protein n=1 Tax=Methanolobus sp. ZRKC3 TaxID=3125786 RepID=UPI00324CCD4A
MDTKKIVKITCALVIVILNLIILSLNAPLGDLEEDATNNLLGKVSEKFQVDEESEWSNSPTMLTMLPTLTMITAIADLATLAYIFKPLLDRRLYYD